MKNAMVWGASGGIGTAVVNRLVDDGWTVIGVVRDLLSVAHPPYHVVEADVTDGAAVQRAVQQAADLAQPINFWIYAVGDIAASKVEEMSSRDWRRILDANLTGAYLAAHHSLPLLAEGAHMVFIGAVSERLRLPRLSAYAAAKAGIEAFAEVLRKEQRGRRVSIVRPRAVETIFWEKVPFSLPHGALKPADVADRILKAYQDGHRGLLNL